MSYRTVFAVITQHVKMTKNDPDIVTFSLATKASHHCSAVHISNPSCEQSHYLPEVPSLSGCGTAPLGGPREPCGTPICSREVCHWTPPCLQHQMLMLCSSTEICLYCTLSHGCLSCSPGYCKGCSHSCPGTKQSPAETTQIVRRKTETLCNHNKD